MREPTTPPGRPHPLGPFPQEFGRYELKRRLGRGGMGTVYLAHDRELDLDVALKIPHPEILEHPSALQRFRLEARAAARLCHPNLAWVIDVNRFWGVDYLVMRYVEGIPLSESKVEGVLEAVGIARTIALGMAAAHRLGVVHRDLKPANIVMTPEGDPVVIDFGLALRQEAEDPGSRLVRAVVGTPRFMAPEQFWGEGGPGVDIYALGVILYGMLAGRPPFEETDIERLREQVQNEPARAPSTIREELDSGLDAICLKALAKHPRDRFESMDVFAAVLGAHLAGASTEWLATIGETRAILAEQVSVPRSSIRFHFVGMGEVAPAASSSLDRLYLDVGNGLRDGVIDHHQDSSASGSTASQVRAHAGRVAGAIRPGRVADDPFTIILHAMPDLDCIASAYLAIGYLADGVFPDGAEVLAHYVTKVDEGSFGLSRENPFSLYAAVIQRSNHLMRLPWNSDHERWRQLVQDGLEIIGHVMNEVRTRGIAITAVDALACPGMFEAADRLEIEKDFDRYQIKMADPESQARPVRLSLPGRYGGKLEVDGLMIRDVQNTDDPERCLFFKDWARTDAERSPSQGGFVALCVSATEGPRRPRRSILSVTPGSSAILPGLGQKLDAAESRRRISVYGVDDRVSDPASGQLKEARPGYDNADPWYDGRAHGQTIIDSPRSGTLLTADEVEAIFLEYGDLDDPVVRPSWLEDDFGPAGQGNALMR